MVAKNIASNEVKFFIAGMQNAVEKSSANFLISFCQKKKNYPSSAKEKFFICLLEEKFRLSVNQNSIFAGLISLLHYLKAHLPTAVLKNKHWNG